MLKRNAIIVAGNMLRSGEGSPALRATIESLASSHAETELVRETARTVLKQLGPQSDYYG
jgi:hypothetical protein